jgi:hypothetical protein
MEQRVVCKQCHGVWLAVGALELVNHFSDGHACIPPGESGHAQYLELVGHIFIQHAKACTSDVFLQLPFVLCKYEHGIGSIDFCRERKLRVNCHVAQVNRGKKWIRLEESIPSMDHALWAYKLLELTYHMLS